MKYLRRFNENANLRTAYRDSNAYHSLIDNGFDIFYESYRIAIGKKSSNTNKDFIWADVESDVIPLLEELVSKYNIFKNVTFIPSDHYDYDSVKTTIDEIINNDDFHISLNLISIEFPTLSPEDNEDFKSKLTSFLYSLGYEDVEYDRNECRFHNPDSWGLINNDAAEICDFIEEFGYEYDDFDVKGSYIEFPQY